MATTAADVLVTGLIDWGVNTVFGIPGDGINGIVEALRQRQKEIRFIQVRHEESAAFMACGYAKVTGRLGVSLATSGPGGIHLLNGLYDAKLDGQEVLTEAFAERGPALVEATVDASEPPLPPKVSFAQARHMVEALVRDTPDGAKLAKQLAKDTIRQVI